MINRVGVPIKVCLIMFLLYFPFCSYSDELGEILLSEPQALFEKANEIQANLLAPKSYEAGVAAYKKAESRIAKGQSVDRIKKDVAKAAESFQQSIDAAVIAQVSLADSFQARSDALSSQANEFAKEEWKNGEDAFYQAAKTLEGGSIKRAERYAKSAEESFRAAELGAIKANYLDETRRLLADAQKNKAYRESPILIARAEANLNQAEKMLSENRYDTDEARFKARTAKIQVLRATKVQAIVLKLKEKKITPEELILQYEGYIEKIGNSLDLDTLFHEGYEKPLREIDNEIGSLEKNSAELVEATRLVSTLQLDVQALEGKLGIQSKKLAQQEAAKARFARMDALFSDAEAVIIMKSGNPILRLTGLNFSSGSAQINSDYFGLLKKVEKAILEYPGRKFIVEGHTDAFGSDLTNQQLSQKRADSVRDYLIANIDSLHSDNIIATGYGENHPIASNENEHGRRKNRRIEITILDQN